MEPSIELISPFPEQDLPAVFMWFQGYRYKTEHFNQSVDEFVQQEMARMLRLTTWGVVWNDELGGYIELEQVGKIGQMAFLSKRTFFRAEISLPALRSALDQTFQSGTEIVLFEPLNSNLAMIRLLRRLGTRDVGNLAPNGVPEKRVLAVTNGDWRRFDG